MSIAFSGSEYTLEVFRTHRHTFALPKYLTDCQV